MTTSDANNPNPDDEDENNDEDEIENRRQNRRDRQQTHIERERSRLRLELTRLEERRLLDQVRALLDYHLPIVVRWREREWMFLWHGSTSRY